MTQFNWHKIKINPLGFNFIDDCCLTDPDRPEDLRAYANSSSELVIEWNPPVNPNGVVTHYIVVGSWQRDDQDYIDKHDPCAERKHFFTRSIGFDQCQ